jgi:hypothetical protein
MANPSLENATGSVSETETAESHHTAPSHQSGRCQDCDHVTADTRKHREATRWTCMMAPREGLPGVVDENWLFPSPYENCWKIRALLRRCPMWRLRIPGQKVLGGMEIKY